MTGKRQATPTCVGCSRTIDEVSLMLRLRQGGMPTEVCGDCVIALAEIAVAVRRPESADITH